MKSDQIAGRWKEVKGKIRHKATDQLIALASDYVEVIFGKLSPLAGALRLG